MTATQTECIQWFKRAGGVVPGHYIGGRAGVSWRTVDSLIKAGVLRIVCDATGRRVELTAAGVKS